MTAEVTTTPLLLRAEPQLYVTALDAALDFYTQRLGFEVAFKYGEPPFYAQVARDGVGVNLRLADTPAFSAEFRESEPDAISVTITVRDAAALYEEFRQRGAVFAEELKQQPWGAATFIVADPDGNLILFAG